MIHALRLAEELAALLDELQTERVPLDALARLVPDHLAEHWQRNRDVLAVIAEAWPRLLAEESALDPAERRHRLLTELAAQWRAAPRRTRRIVAAGSTGSIPATRALLRVIAHPAARHRGAARPRPGHGRGELARAHRPPIRSTA